MAEEESGVMGEGGGVRAKADFGGGIWISLDEQRG